MRATLPDEVAAFLRDRGPSTASEVSLGIRARRDDVDEVLAESRFTRVARPEHGSPRAAYFNVSEAVLTADAPGSAAGQKIRDKDFLLAVLADGRWHTLTEILSRSFRDRGVGLTVHSRAANLRRDGHTIANRRLSPGPGKGYKVVSEYKLVRRAGNLRALAGSSDGQAEAA